MESQHIKAKNYSNVFVDLDKDDNGNDEIYLALHIVGASCSVHINMEQAAKLRDALTMMLSQNEQVV